VKTNITNTTPNNCTAVSYIDNNIPATTSHYYATCHQGEQSHLWPVT